MADKPYVHNVLEGERFRLTCSMQQSGAWTFSVIGLHTPMEVIGLLRCISLLLEKKSLNQRNPDLVKELERGY